MKNSLIVLALLFLSGCAILQSQQRPSEKANPVQKVLDSWVNQSEAQLINQWGLPDKQMVNDTQKIYEYRKCGAPVGMVFGAGLSNPIIVTNQQCARWTFMITNGNIVQDRFAPE